MEVEYGTSKDIDSWMDLVQEVSWNFPGLETKKAMEDHQKTVLRFMDEHRALCVKDLNVVIGVLLLSKKHNMICCLAVSPKYRRKGIASLLLEKALTELDRTRDITVTTFREDDEKGNAPRRLYQKFGFQEGNLLEEFGYPVQEFILKSNISFRNAVPGDERILAQIQTESWKTAFADILSPEELQRCTVMENAVQMYHSVLQQKACSLAIEYVSEQPHCIAAWGNNRCDLEESVGELICIHSMPKNWAKGYGSTMMKYVLTQLQQEGYESAILWVFESNIRARKFYEKHGFKLTEQKRQTNGTWEIMYMRSL